MIQHHGDLSEAEKLAIGELMRHEQLCAKKYALYLDQSPDPHVKSILREVQNVKMRHISTLNNLLHQPGMPAAGMTGTGPAPTT